MELVNHRQEKYEKGGREYWLLHAATFCVIRGCQPADATGYLFAVHPQTQLRITKERLEELTVKENADISAQTEDDRGATPGQYLNAKPQSKTARRTLPRSDEVQRMSSNEARTSVFHIQSKSMRKTTGSIVMVRNAVAGYLYSVITDEVDYVVGGGNLAAQKNFLSTRRI